MTKTQSRLLKTSSTRLKLKSRNHDRAAEKHRVFTSTAFLAVGAVAGLDRLANLETQATTRDIENELAWRFPSVVVVKNLCVAVCVTVARLGVDCRRDGA